MCAGVERPFGFDGEDLGVSLCVAEWSACSGHKSSTVACRRPEHVHDLTESDKPHVRCSVVVRNEVRLQLRVQYLCSRQGLRTLHTGRTSPNVHADIQGVTKNNPQYYRHIFFYFFTMILH